MTDTNLAPDLYINREISWLEFNSRVLDEAENGDRRLLERVRFLSIVASNLDEFFEIRVAGLKQQREAAGDFRNPDGLTPHQQLSQISARAHQQVERQYRVWRESVLPGLKESGINFVRSEELTPKERKWTARYFEEQVAPVLTPLAVDPAHPFPMLLNKSLNLALALLDRRPSAQGERAERLALVQVPRTLPRQVALPREGGGEARLLFLVDLMRMHVGGLFPSQKCLGIWSFRVTRNSNLYVEEDEAENLLEAIESELRKRNKGQAVRLEVEKGVRESVLSNLVENLGLSGDDVYEVEGPVNMQRLMALYDETDRPDLKDAPWVASSFQEDEEGLFASVRKGDILLHHPYESFSTVMDFIAEAAQDPAVLAIKMTLYRTSSDSPIVRSLIKAAGNGKQVAVLMELKARFDEEANIHWARAMEEAGIHVVYGMVGLKTHCKTLLVIRKEGEELKRYVHLGTGNYHPRTARLYTDVGLLSCRGELGRDVAALFNMLTGFSGAGDPPPMEKLLLAPHALKDAILEKIGRETEAARRGLPARILAKMNALVDASVIAALYEASQAGVRVDLLVRGICCLRPGLPGVSENIRVRSIVDRFLEHSRVFYFENGGQSEVWLGSADWMPRNFMGRVEVLFPLEEEALKRRVVDEILAVCLADNTQAREMNPDGSYRRLAPAQGEAPLRSQQVFMDLAQGRTLGLPGPEALPPDTGALKSGESSGMLSVRSS